MDKVRLRDICDFQNGYAFSSDAFYHEGVGLIRIGDIVEGKIDKSSMVFIKENDNYEKFTVFPNDLLIAMSGATTGKLGINTCDEKFYLNQRVGKFNNLKIDKKLLFYILSTKIKENLQKSNGSAIPNLSSEQIKNIIIPKNCVEEQQKIVAELDSLSDIIGKKKEQLKELDNLSQSLFHEMFGDIERNEKGWKASTLYDACDSLMAGGDVPQKSCSKVKTMDYNIPILTNGEKNNGLYGYTDVVKVNKPCVTISARGTIGYAVVRKEPFYPAVRLIVVIPKSEFLNLVYLQMVLNIFSKPTGQGVSIPQLTIPTIKNKKILLPPMELQNEFANRVEEIEKQKDLINKSLVEVQTLFDSRMQKYFGE